MFITLYITLYNTLYNVTNNVVRSRGRIRKAIGPRQVKVVCACIKISRANFTRNSARREKEGLTKEALGE